MKIALGKLGSPFSLDGRISAFLYSNSEPSWSFGWIGSKEFKVILCKYPYKGKKDLCICKIEGIESPEKVSILSGREFWIDRIELPKLQSDEVYLCDLIGLPVVKGADILGYIAATHDFGAGIVLQVEEKHFFQSDKDNSSNIIELAIIPSEKILENQNFKKNKNQNSITDEKPAQKLSSSQRSVSKKQINNIFIHWQEIDKIEQNKVILKD